MKHIFYILPVLCAILLSACSSDEPQEVFNIDKKIVGAYETGAKTTAFKLTTLDYFRRDDPKSEWKRITDSHIDYDYVTYDRIVFDQGDVKGLLNLDPYRGSVYNQCESVLTAYKKMTGDRSIYYVSVPFALSRETNVMKIGRFSYVVKEMTEESLVLDDYVPEIHDAYPFINFKTILKYTNYEIPQSELDRMSTFPTEKEALLDIVKRAREYFGDKIDRNEIFKTEIIFDDPIIDLNLLEQEIYDYFEERGE